MERSLRARLEQIASEHSEEDGVITRADGLRYLSPVRAEAFLGLVRAGSTLATQLDKELEGAHGLGLRAFEVLLFLAVFSEDGSLGMTDLTAHAPLSQSRISRLVADLEVQGLVERSPAEHDGRGIRVSITELGRERFRAAQDTHLAGLEEHLYGRLSQTEIRQLARICSKILDSGF